MIKCGSFGGNAKDPWVATYNDTSCRSCCWFLRGCCNCFLGCFGQNCFQILSAWLMIDWLCLKEWKEACDWSCLDFMSRRRVCQYLALDAVWLTDFDTSRVFAWHSVEILLPLRGIPAIFGAPTVCLPIVANRERRSSNLFWILDLLPHLSKLITTGRCWNVWMHPAKSE
jgi:hypothetical protein